MKEAGFKDVRINATQGAGESEGCAVAGCGVNFVVGRAKLRGGQQAGSDGVGIWVLSGGSGEPEKIAEQGWSLQGM